MTIQEHFKKFYDMEPYIFIDEKEWKHIMETYEKDQLNNMLWNLIKDYDLNYNAKIMDKLKKDGVI